MNVFIPQRPLFLFAVLSTFLFSNLLSAQSSDYYKGMHYGAHQPWKFFSVTHVDKIGDTLVFERNVFPNEPPFDKQRLLEINYVKMLVHDENHVTVLKDSLNYNWPGGPKFTKKRTLDQMSLYYHDARKVNFDALEGASYTVTPNDLTFTSIPSVALYLMQTDIDIDFEKKIFIAQQDTLRPFVIRVLDKLRISQNPTVWVYDISINPLDKHSLYSGKIYLTSDTKKIAKIEYVANDFKHKSVLNEYWFGPDYELQ